MTKLLEKLAGKKTLHPMRVKTKDLGHGQVEVVISTNSMDRHGEILDIKSLDVSKYNGVVLVNHNYEGFPIAKNLSLTKTGDTLKGVCQFAIDEYDEANTIYKLVAGGYWPDVSIGFIPGDFDFETMTWTNCEMIEYSFVTVGANRDAKVTAKALKEAGVTEDEMKKAVKKITAVAEKKEVDPTPAPEPTQDPAPTEPPVITKGVAVGTLDPSDRAYLQTLLAQCNELDTHIDAADDLADDILQGLSTFLGVPNPDEDAETDADELAEALQNGIRRLDYSKLTNVKALMQALEDTLPEAKAALALLEKPEKSGLKGKKRKIVLVQAKQSVRKVDRISEAILYELKQTK